MAGKTISRQGLERNHEPPTTEGHLAACGAGQIPHQQGLTRFESRGQSGQGRGETMPPTAVDVIVRGGQVVTASEAYEASVAIRGEKIVAIGPAEVLPPADQYFDASGKFVLPGAIDCHVHLGGHDDYHTGGIAAAHAGLTTLIPFAMYDLARRETLPQSIKRHNEEVGKVSVVDFSWHFILNNDPYIFAGLPEALQMGVSSYKMFMTYKKRKDRMCSDSFICRAME